ncbi:MAG: hypothetical protein AMJ43_07980 [Coxiella sp. DG_40]|nr:MAG: hypothetical protein AMJ43_07980 [Coxiella sp. DG_40]
MVDILNLEKNMPSDEDIFSKASDRMGDFIRVNERWRVNYMRPAIGMYDGSSQWERDDYDRKKERKLTPKTVNKVAPIVDAVKGFEIQNRSKKKYYARNSTSNRQSQYKDIVQDGVEYITADGKVPFENSQAFADMCICGIGATENIIDYDKNPNGEPHVFRVEPYLLGWDFSARRKNLLDANWCFYVQIVDARETAEALQQAGHDITASQILSGTGIVAGLQTYFLDYYNRDENQTLGAIVHYQWREKRSFYRVFNPIPDIPDILKDPNFNGQEIMQIMQQLGEKYNFDPANDRVFSIPLSDKKDVKEIFEYLSIPISRKTFIKQQKYAYFRASMVGAQIISKEPNYSQDGFSLKFMTGKYAPKDNAYYGLIYPAIDSQRMFNGAVTDMQGYVETVPAGGVFIEASAVDDAQNFVGTYARAKEVTILADGAISQNRIMPKGSPPTPDGLVKMLALSEENIFSTTGVYKDFLGISDGDNRMQSGILHSKRVRQGLAVLGDYFDSKKFYDKEQGRLFIDMLRVLAENAPGRSIYTGEGESRKAVQLLESNIAAEYDVIIEDVPQSPDEKQETFTKLIELVGILPDQMKSPIMQLSLDYLPLKQEEQEKVKKALAPRPPQQPDPLLVEQQKVSIQSMAADAELKKAQAQKIILEAQEQAALLRNGSPQADVEETKAKTAKYMSEAGENMFNINSNV